MSKMITLSSDEKTLEEFEEITKKLGKSKSQLFRDMIKYFYEKRENIANGLRIVEEV